MKYACTQNKMLPCVLAPSPATELAFLSHLISHPAEGITSAELQKYCYLVILSKKEKIAWNKQL